MFFSEKFGVAKKELDDYGALDICLDQDLPLFVDPFLLYASDKREYQKLHENIIAYLSFLKEKSFRRVNSAELKWYYCFKEIPQNWLGFTESGNSGSGLNLDFAKKLYKSLHGIFRDFGKNELTETSHLEKLVLLEEGVGKDKISDFTTNLIIDFLAKYTEKFSLKHIPQEKLVKATIQKAVFDSRSGQWLPKSYTLPKNGDNFVLLTPKDILARDDTWINKRDLYNTDLTFFMEARENETQRLVLNEHFREQLALHEKDHSKQVSKALVRELLLENPHLLDRYIGEKEKDKQDALKNSVKSVDAVEQTLCIDGPEAIEQFKNAPHPLFFENTLKEARWYAEKFKDCIENNDGYKVINSKTFDKPRDEKIVQAFFGLILKTAVVSSADREVNNGRGPVDFKLSRGGNDSTLIELKLASNTQLKHNLKNQLEIYKKANGTENGVVIIIYYNQKDLERANKILDELGLLGDKNVYLVDARNDNKPTGSKAR